MKTAYIIEAFRTIWKQSTLLNVPLRNSRQTAFTDQPYALITAKHIEHSYNSGNWFTAKYRVDIRTYGGKGLVDAQSISHDIGNLFDFQQGTLQVKDSRCLLLKPEEEGHELSNDDLYGEDVLISHNIWIVTLLESKEPIAVQTQGL